jgi:hypothetical protein
MVRQHIAHACHAGAHVLHFSTDPDRTHENRFPCGCLLACPAAGLWRRRPQPQHPDGRTSARDRPPRLGRLAAGTHARGLQARDRARRQLHRARRGADQGRRADRPPRAGARRHHRRGHQVRGQPQNDAQPRRRLDHRLLRQRLHAGRNQDAARSAGRFSPAAAVQRPVHGPDARRGDHSRQGRKHADGPQHRHLPRAETLDLHRRHLRRQCVRGQAAGPAACRLRQRGQRAGVHPVLRSVESAVPAQQDDAQAGPADRRRRCQQRRHDVAGGPLPAALRLRRQGRQPVVLRFAHLQPAWTS